MVGIIVFSALSLLMAFLIGGTLMFDDGKDIEAIPWVYFICGLLLVFSVTETVDKVRDYYSKKEYPLTEYRIKKKISITEEENTVKVDTVCFLVKINK